MILWQASLLTGCLVIFGLGKIWKESFYFAETWTTFEAVVYRCFSKTGWSLALSWIVFSCHHGYGGEKRCQICILLYLFQELLFSGIINSFLSWDAFVPLSKLTFAAYLNHLTIEQIVFYTFASPLYVTDLLMVSFVKKKKKKNFRSNPVFL